jgi:hypothetical protein
VKDGGDPRVLLHGEIKAAANQSRLFEMVWRSSDAHLNHVKYVLYSTHERLEQRQALYALSYTVGMSSGVYSWGCMI